MQRTVIMHVARTVALIPALQVLPLLALRAQQSDDQLAGRYDPKIATDDFNRTRSIVVLIGEWHAGKHKDLKADCGRDQGTIGRLAVTQIHSHDSTVVYRMLVEYWGADEVFRRGAPLQWIADTTHIDLPPFGESAQHTTAGGSVDQSMLYTATEDQVRALASAGTIRAQVPMSQGACTLALMDGSRATLRQFVAHEMRAP